MKNQVQNPHVYKTSFYLSCLWCQLKRNKKKLGKIKCTKTSISTKTDKYLISGKDTKSIHYFSQNNVFPTNGNHFPLVKVTESHKGCGERLVKSYNRNLHCPIPNPKPLVFPHVVLERSVVQTDCDPAGKRPERTSEHT